MSRELEGEEGAAREVVSPFPFMVWCDLEA